eukprot:TRINITY_DN3460_c0_g1_i1.p1 TRINITY_DN3460_c0_g1~~TRINITY_DN3460_c0_g1_i1.p1  ORF type:complete len:171 (+),score=33.88 TRINITY_DN3460_c0_g1_i1:875-1387(+)
MKTQMAKLHYFMPQGKDTKKSAHYCSRTELILTSKTKNGKLHCAGPKNKTEQKQLVVTMLQVVDLLLSCGAIPLKESGAEKEKSIKKGKDAKKPVPEKGQSKKYVLTLYKDGIWRSLNAEEMRDFLEKNREAAQYLKNPALLSNLKVPSVSPAVLIFDHWDKAAKKITGH